MASSQEKKPERRQAVAQDESEHLSGRALYLVLVGVLLAIFLIALDQTIVTNALPRIASAFNALDQITWIPTAFFITQAPFLLIWGQLNTMFSSKWLFMEAMVLFELGSLLSGVATSVIFLSVGRAVQGLGAAGIFVGSMAMTATIIPLKDRPKFFGFFGALFALSGILGPLIGGAFVDHVSWRWCFYINLPLSVPTFWFCFQFLPSKPSTMDRLNPPTPPQPGESVVSYTAKRTIRRLAKLDWIGCVLSLGCTISLVLALTWGGVSRPWNSAPVIATLVVAFVVFIIFGWWEIYLGDKALVPMKLFKNRTQVGASLAAFMTRSGFFVAVFELPLYFQAVKGHSPTKAGLDLIPITLAVVIAGGFIGFGVSKFGRYWHVMVFGPLFGAVGFGLVFIMDEHASTGLNIGLQILMGVGIGSTFQNTMLAIQADTERDLIPQATSIVTYCQFLGGTVSLAIAGGIFSSKLASGLRLYAPDAPLEDLLHSVTKLQLLPPDQHAGAVHAYVKALQWCMGPIGAAAMVLTSLCSLMIRNLSVRKTEPMAPKDVEKDGASATPSVTNHADLERGTASGPPILAGNEPEMAFSSTLENEQEKQRNRDTT